MGAQRQIPASFVARGVLVQPVTMGSSQVRNPDDAPEGTLKPGDLVVSVKDTYGGTNKIFTEFLPHFNVKVTLCDTTDHDAIEAEIAAAAIYWLSDECGPISGQVVDLEQYPFIGRNPPKDSSTIK